MQLWYLIWTELNPAWKCSQSGKQPSDIRRLFLLDVWEGMVMRLMPSVGRRSLSPTVAFLPATRRAMTAVGVPPVRKTPEPAASGKRKRSHICTARQDRKCRVNCIIFVICLFVVTTVKQCSSVTMCSGQTEEPEHSLGEQLNNVIADADSAGSYWKDPPGECGFCSLA